MRILYLKNDPSIDRSTQFVSKEIEPETIQFIVGARLPVLYTPICRSS